MANLARFLAVLLALLIAADAPAQMKGKRGGKGGQRESVDLYHVTTEELHADLKLKPTRNLPAQLSNAHPLASRQLCDAAYGGLASASGMVYVPCTNGLYAVRVGARSLSVAWRGPSFRAGPRALQDVR